jgi:XRE family aerobic/anaerobic benzoate catabolism transcriptional regulator
MLGRAIAALRIERGLTRYGLVSAAGISYPYLREVENGTKVPSSAMLGKLAAALHVMPSELLERAEQIAADPRNGISERLTAL